LKKFVKAVGLGDVDNANLSLCKCQIYLFWKWWRILRFRKMSRVLEQRRHY